MAGGSSASPQSGSQDAEAPPEAQTTGTARYIADLTVELARLAADANLDLLAHFLTMARVEAEMAARRAAADKT